jgi:hypothetical protein
VVGADRSVGYIACDHLVTDGFSCAIKAHEIATIYAATVTGVAVILPEVGSYLDYGRQEYVETETVRPNDPRIESWRGFVARNGHVFTEFPVELSMKKGEWHPAMVDVAHLLDASQAEEFERLCYAHNARVVSGLLAVNSIACTGLVHAVYCAP